MLKLKDCARQDGLSVFTLSVLRVFELYPYLVKAWDEICQPITDMRTCILQGQTVGIWIVILEVVPMVYDVFTNFEHIRT